MTKSNSAGFLVEEMKSSTDVVRHFSEMLDALRNNDLDKIAVLRNNRPEAVILPVEKYLDIVETLEDLELYRIAKQRENTPRDQYISYEEVLQRHNPEK